MLAFPVCAYHPVGGEDAMMTFTYLFLEDHSPIIAVNLFPVGIRTHRLNEIGLVFDLGEDVLDAILVNKACPVITTNTDVNIFVPLLLRK